MSCFLSEKIIISGVMKTIICNELKQFLLNCVKEESVIMNDVQLTIKIYLFCDSSHFDSVSDLSRDRKMQHGRNSSSNEYVPERQFGSLQHRPSGSCF